MSKSIKIMNAQDSHSCPESPFFYYSISRPNCLHFCPFSAFKVLWNRLFMPCSPPYSSLSTGLPHFSNPWASHTVAFRMKQIQKCSFPTPRNKAWCCISSPWNPLSSYSTSFYSPIDPSIHSCSLINRAIDWWKLSWIAYHWSSKPFSHRLSFSRTFHPNW